MSRAPSIGAVILARMDSRRLPGKVLALVKDRPLLWYVASRIPRDALDRPIVLATSDREIDAPLSQAAEDLGLAVFRGSAEDVAGRALGAGAAFGMDGIFRVNGDSPFLEATLLRRAAAIYRNERPDLVTNLLPRSFPYGVSVELFDRRALASRLEKGSSAHHREHVTACFYEDPAAFRICNIAEDRPVSGPDPKAIRLTIDEPADLEAFRAFLEEVEDGWTEVCYRTAFESGFFGPR